MKITREQDKLHDEAVSLINLSRPLTDDEIEIVYRQYNPMAENSIGKGAIYFTPYDLASDFAAMCQPKGVVVDLCAGIGILAHHVLKHDYAGWGSRSNLCGDIKRIICIEINEQFVEIGKKLVPEAEWICGNMLNLDILTKIGKVDCVISNPPYGQIFSKKEHTWTKVKGPIQWLAIEVSLRLAYNGAMMILPSVDCDTDMKHKGTRLNREKYLDKYFPGIHMENASIDASIYKNQWIGAKPDVTVVDIDNNDAEWDRPYGFADVYK